jgi:hypothetical protein
MKNSIRECILFLRITTPSTYQIMFAYFSFHTAVQYELTREQLTPVSLSSIFILIWAFNIRTSISPWWWSRWRTCNDWRAGRGISVVCQWLTIWWWRSTAPSHGHIQGSVPCSGRMSASPQYIWQWRSRRCIICWAVTSIICSVLVF